MKAYDATQNVSDASNEVCETTMTSSQTTWSIETVFSGGETGAVECTAIGIDSGGNIHIVFVHDLNPSGGEYNRPLKYMTNESGTWSTSTVHSNIDTHCTMISLAVDANDKVHIAYPIDDGISYSTNVTGSWVTTTIYQNVVSYLFGPSLAIDTSGVAHISYVDRSPENRTYYSDLYYVTNSGGSWSSTTVDTVQGVTVSSIYYEDCFSEPSIALSSSRSAYIAYHDCTNSYLKYATNASGSWNTFEVTSNDDNIKSFFPSIALDNNDYTHISYSDNALNYMFNAGDSWSATTISTTQFEAAFSNSLVVDANGKAHIVYAQNPGDPNTVWLDYATNESGTWITETVDANGATGYFASIVTDSNNNPHISYSNVSGDLMYAARQQ